MARARTISTLLGMVAAAILLVCASAAQAASLHIADAEATVVQDQTASFTIELSASGALTCRASATVMVDSSYLVASDGAVSSDDALPVTFSAAAAHGAGHNCDPTWDGAPGPYQFPATVTALPGTAPGDYTAPVHYVVQNAPGTGPAGKLSNAGTVNVTIHVQAAAIAEPPAEEPPAEQVVLGVRDLGLRPTLGKTELLELVSGTVLYRTPGGKVAVLGNAVLVPNGTRIDATNGFVRVTVAHDSRGDLNRARVWGGGFSVRQVIQGTTTFTLADGLGARGGGKAAHAARAQGKRRKRHGVRALWVDAHGNFKTRGHHASAIARGTVWVTQELTGGRTRVSVKRGAVAVRDLVTHRTIVVRAGHSYTARARRAVAHRAPAFTGRA